MLFVPLCGKLPFRCRIQYAEFTWTTARLRPSTRGSRPQWPARWSRISAMRRVFTGSGNRRARRSIALRREVAALIGARQNEIVFTSGGTEANNLAIRGLCEAAMTHGRHLITSSIEHPSVAGVCADLEKRGWEVTRLPVYQNGIVRVEDVAAALRPETVLITIMMANNEIGTIQPIAEIGALVRERRAAGATYICGSIPMQYRLRGDCV